MDNNQNRRTKLFIDKSFQSKFIAGAVGIAIVVVLIAFGAIGAIFPVKAAGGDPNAIADSFYIALLALLLLVTILIVIIVRTGLVMSHRIVGPIYAFNRHMIWLRDGIYIRNLKLRDKDEFKSLANIFNNMQEVLRQRVKETIDTCGDTEKGLAELKESLDSGQFDADQVKAKIDALVADIEQHRNKNEGYLS